MMEIVGAILVGVASIVTIIVALLTFTGYRIGIVWKNKEEVTKASIPVTWVLLFIIVGWILYFGA